MSLLQSTTKKESKQFIIERLPENLSHNGFIVLNNDDATELNLSSGDMLKLKGARTSGAILRISKNATPGICYLDPTNRLNIGARLGETVSISKIDDEYDLTKVTFSPVAHEVDDELQGLIGNQLIGRVLTKGDHITIQTPNQGVLEFQVEKIKTTGRNIFGKISIQTEVEVNSNPAKRPLLKTGNISFADIAGMEEIINQIQEVVITPLIHPELFEKAGKKPIRGILLHGAPGTGKSMIAKAIARETQASFMDISAPSILVGGVGGAEKKLRSLFYDAQKESPSVLFIDEIDSISLDRRNCSESSRTTLAQLLTLMDGVNDRGEVIVIGATNRLNDIDDALLRPGRFERIIECPIPDKDARFDILELISRRMPLSEDLDLNYLAENCVGFVGADLEKLCTESVYKAALREFGHQKMIQDESLDIESLTIGMEDFISAINDMNPSLKNKFNRQLRKTDFDSLVGLNDVKNILEKKLILPIKNPELYKIADLQIGSGILLHGPPGTGKTAIARAAANIAGAEFLSVKGPELLSMWVGESERGIREVFDRARRMSPCVLFFDEFDSLGESRGDSLGNRISVKPDVVNQILSEMDGIESSMGIVVIAATNNLNRVDSAFLRPGRLDEVVYVGLPNKKDYQEIYSIHLGKVTLAEEMEIFDSINSLDEGLSGAELMGIAIKTKEHAILRHLESNPEGNIDGFKITKKDVDAACWGKSICSEVKSSG